MQELDKQRTIRTILADPEGSSLAKYRPLIAGDLGISRFLRYKLMTALLGPRPVPLV